MMMVVVMFVCHNSIFLQSKAMADISAIPNYYEINSTITLYPISTLMASTKKGNRPSYIRAAKPEISIPLYEKFCEDLSKLLGKPVGTGEFGAEMKVKLLNDGPVTICIDTKNKE